MKLYTESSIPIIEYDLKNDTQMCVLHWGSKSVHQSCYTHQSGRLYFSQLNYNELAITIYMV